LKGKHACIRENSTGKCDYEWDKPLPAEEWPHPARRGYIMETTYPTENFTDGSKIEGKVSGRE
jgi:hypothetical protein